MSSLLEKREAVILWRRGIAASFGALLEFGMEKWRDLRDLVGGRVERVLPDVGMLRERGGGSLREAMADGRTLISGWKEKRQRGEVGGLADHR